MIGLLFMLVWLAVIVAALAGLWKAFEKMGRQGWEGIVPLYNIYVLLQITGKPVWWLVLAIIPFVNIVFVVLFILVCIEVAKGFGKGAGFGVGLALLGFIFWPMIGFSEKLGLGEMRWQGVTAAPGGFPVTSAPSAQ